MRTIRSTLSRTTTAPWRLAILILTAFGCGDSRKGSGGETPASMDGAVAGDEANEGGGDAIAGGRRSVGGSGAVGGSGSTAGVGARGGSGGTTNGGRGGSVAAGGSGGKTGATDAGGPRDSGAPTGDAVMPWDDSIYGALDEGAVYIFAEPYVTVIDGRVALLQNAADPGTRDLVFQEAPTPGYAGTARPTWHASGGLNGRSYASFSGLGERGVATGFDFSPEGGTNEIAVQVVGRYPSVANIAAYGVVVTTTNNQSWMSTFQLRTDDPFDTWRTNGDILNPAHNIDYLTPEASNDTAWHLHEGYAQLTGLLAWYDGMQFGPGGTGGPRPGHGVLTDVSVGGGYPAGFGGFAPCDIHEVVVTEGRDLAQLAAYRTRRIEPLYGLELQ